MKGSRITFAMLPLVLSVAGFAGNAEAGYVTSHNNCSAANVTLGSISRSADGVVVYDGAALDATTCFGVVSGNDSGNGQAKGDNRGEKTMTVSSTAVPKAPTRVLIR